jgi:succinate-acetate transporter protein
MASHDLEKSSYGKDETANPLHRPGLADPAPLGLFSFGSTTLILSLYNLQTRGVHHPNAVIGMAIFCGGLAQLLAGMWEFPKGNTFGATAFSGYGAFWLSYATILLPGSGAAAAYAENPKELGNALGIYLLTWGIVTFLFFIVTLRKTIAFVILFGLLVIVFGLLAGAEFTGNVK